MGLAMRGVVLGALIGFAALEGAPPTFAEKAPMSPAALRDVATHVVRGTVTAVSSRKEAQGRYAVTQHYVAEVRVLAVEKGEGIGLETPLYARYWSQQWVGPGPMPPGTSGHAGLPTAGQTLRIYLARNAYDGFRDDNHDGGFNVIGANGFEALRPEDVAAPAAPVPPETFPASWRGTWQGTMTTAAPAGATTAPTPMSLTIQPTETEGRWRFALRYGQQPLREYALVARDPKVGAYELDERNSIVLPATYLDGELFSWFSMNGELLLARYRRVGDALTFDLTQTALAPSTTTGGKDQAPSVGGHAVRFVQRATLLR
jgi:hypothetical protein